MSENRIQRHFDELDHEQQHPQPQSVETPKVIIVQPMQQTLPLWAQILSLVLTGIVTAVVYGLVRMLLGH